MSSLIIYATTFYVNYTLVVLRLALALRIGKVTTFQALRIAQALSLYTFLSVQYKQTILLLLEPNYTKAAQSIIGRTQLRKSYLIYISRIPFIAYSNRQALNSFTIAFKMCLSILSSVSSITLRTLMLQLRVISILLKRRLEGSLRIGQYVKQIRLVLSTSNVILL